DGEDVADFRVRDAERLQPLEKGRVVRFEQREIRLVIDDLNARRHLQPAFRSLEFHIIRIAHELRRDEHAIAGQHGADSSAREWRTLSPRACKVPSLIGYIHADDGKSLVGLGFLLAASDAEEAEK